MKIVSKSNKDRDLFEASNLTRSQFLIWLGQKLNPETPLYNMAFTFKISGNVDPVAFRNAFQKLIDESDAMRTVVEEIDGIPMQRVLPHLKYDVQMLDFRSKKNAEEVYETWAEQRCQSTLQLSERLFDSVLIRVSNEITVWYMNQHHLTIDAWSSTLLFNCMSDYYALATTDNLPNAEKLYPYQAYRDHEQSIRHSPIYGKAVQYWENKLETPVDPLLFYDRRPSENSTRTQRVYCELGSRRSRKIREIALEKQVCSLTNDMTLFNIFATLMFAWLHRVTDDRNLSIGTFSHNRSTAQFKSTIGMFIEIYPLYTTINDGETFLSLIRRLGKETLGFLAHAQPGTGNASTGHSYQAILNFINASFGDFDGLPTTSRWIHPGHGDRGHGLRLQVHDFDNVGDFQLHFDLNTAVFSEELREFLVQHFLQIVDAFIEDRCMALQDIDLLGEKNRRYIITDFNNHQAANAPELSVLQLFEHQVKMYGERIAVDTNTELMTYQDLNDRASRLAHRLVGLGLGHGQIAAIVCERSTDLLIAILGVMKTGAAYVPIDPTHPVARMERVISDTGAMIVLTQEKLQLQFQESSSVIYVAEDPDGVSSSLEPPVLRGPDPDDSAYIIYTSGSTGAPKGVVISHRALSNYINWAKRQYASEASCNMALFSTIAADLTVTSVFLPLVCGGTVVVFGEEPDGPDMSVLKAIKDEKVDILKLTPAHLSLINQKDTTVSRIKSIIVGGEQFKTVLARKVLDVFPMAQNIYNEYGPAEATVGCMIHKFEPEHDISTAVPIGKPIDNMKIYVLDVLGDPVPFGFTGEIFVAGVGLADGYLGQTALTSQYFVENPFEPGSKMYRTGDLARWRTDGILEYCGRVDDQLKVKGYRIEPAEVESALSTHPVIIEVVVNGVEHATSTVVQVRNCRKCGLASNHPEAKMDESGVCQICQDFEQQRSDAHRYLRNADDLEAVFAEVKSSRTAKYDCVMLLSGGKDSTYALYQIVAMGLKPLVFSLDNGYISDQAKVNIHNVVENLGLELVWGSTPGMNEIFVDSLKRFSNVCNGCHKVIYTLSINLALEHGIRHIVTGLSRGQFFETRVSQFYKSKVFASSDIDHEITEARKAYHRMDDAVSRCLDVSAFQDDKVFERIQFIDYYRYTDIELDQMMEFLDNETAWVRPTDTGRSTNCLINEAGIYVHQRERGFHNYALPYSWDVRLGHKKRDEALDELDDDIIVSNAQRILGEIGYQESGQSIEETRLAAYYTAGVDIPGSDLRAFLSRSLPEFMVPSYFIRVDKMPLNPSGKVDRKALPLPGKERLSLGSPYIAPRNEMEERLVTIWESVLPIKPIGVKDSFFDLGGDSISNIRIVACANLDGLKLSSEQVFSHPTIAELAVLVHLDVPDSNSETSVHESVSYPVENTASSEEQAEQPYPLSPLQLGILFHCLSAPASGVYVEQYCCKLEGRIDEKTFRLAWQQVVARHGTLRTAIAWQDRDEPVQVESANVPLAWDIQDWRQIKNQQSQLENWLQRDSGIGFNLSQVPLTRFALIRLNESQWQFVWSFHHIILDGWSSQIILKDVFDTYEGLNRSEPVSYEQVTPYHRYIEALQQQNQTESRSYWREALKGFTEPTCPRDLDADSDVEPAVERIIHVLPETLTTALQTLARENRLTLNTLIQGAWAIILGNYSQCQDVVFGTTVSGRQIDLAGIDKMTGLFINTLPVRASLTPSKSTLEWLNELQQQQIASRRFESSSLVEIQKCSDIPAGENLFDTLVVFENNSLLAEVNGHPGFTVSDVNYRDHSNFPLAVLAIQDVEFQLAFVYAQNRFSTSFVRQISDCFIAILQAFTERPDRLLSTLPTLSPTQFQKYVVEKNQSERNFPDDMCVHHLIETRANEQPAALAVVSCDGSLTYAELDGRATRLAHELRRRGVVQGAYVGLYLDRSLEMIIAMLGVLKSGAAYVPLDPDYPTDRLEFMITDASISVLLTRSNVDSRVTFSKSATITLDTLWNDLPTESNSKLDEMVVPGDLAYVMYTSGSSGKPKGVMISHENVVNSTLARINFYSPVVNFLLLSSISFDSSVAGIYWTLCQGGCLHLPDPDDFADTDHIAQLIQDQNVSHLLCIPSFWQLMLEQPGLSSLKTVIVAGEACPSRLPQQHFKVLPDTSLYNEYGPTEGTVWSTVFDCSSSYASSSVPIGLPIDNVRVFVLDDQLRPLPIGVPGELYIGGAGISRGYLNQPELTADRFIDSPTSLPLKGKLYRTGDLVRYQSDGYLEFIGRTDEQVKLRGFRIELGEIESVLSQHQDISETAVVLRDAEITAYDSDSVVTDLTRQLLGLGNQKALALLAEVESIPSKSRPGFDRSQEGDTNIARPESIETDDFRVDLTFHSDDFIRPPTETQRNWLLYQLLGDIKDDLNYLDAVSKTFVKGRGTHLDALKASPRTWSEDQIMEEWQTPLMQAMAKHVTDAHGDVLEIGYGRGVSARYIQQGGVRSHTVIEANPECIEKYFKPWQQANKDRDISLVSGMWQDVLQELGSYDGIFFHTFPMNEEEFISYVIESATFAEHFFAEAAKLLRPGGVFTYLTTEISSLSRRHQRALFKHFSSLTLSVEPVTVPEDTGDTWWAESMVVIKAVK